jgi:hypothetical protein
LVNDKDDDVEEKEDVDECRISNADDIRKGRGWW